MVLIIVRLIPKSLSTIQTRYKYKNTTEIWYNTVQMRTYQKTSPCEHSKSIVMVNKCILRQVLNWLIVWLCRQNLFQWSTDACKKIDDH